MFEPHAQYDPLLENGCLRKDALVKSISRLNFNLFRMRLLQTDPLPKNSRTATQKLMLLEGMKSHVPSTILDEKHMHFVKKYRNITQYHSQAKSLAKSGHTSCLFSNIFHTEGDEADTLRSVSASSAFRQMD